MRIEFDWLDPKYQIWVEIIQYKNCLANMKPSCLPVKVYAWDRLLRVEGCHSQVQHILFYSNMEECIDSAVTCDLDVLKARLLKLNRNKWWIEVSEKSKLDTFLKIHDPELRQPVIKKNLSKSQSSIIMKFKCGVLPLLIETGRFKDIPRELRICKICDAGTVESEQHFLLKCKALKDIREKHQKELPDKCENTESLDEECIREMLHPEFVKQTSIMIGEMFQKRKEHMYKLEKGEEEQ